LAAQRPGVAQILYDVHHLFCFKSGASYASVKDRGGSAMQNSAQTFPDFSGKPRPIVSTLDHAIIRRFLWGELLILLT
jgi:hypothetical protein